MASTNKTTNYQLSQFTNSDIPKWLGDYNSDMTKIDTAIKNVSNTASGKLGSDNVVAGTNLKKTTSGNNITMDLSDSVANKLANINNSNYSTTEIDTGTTWVDGRKIYKKTVSTGTLPNNTTSTISHGISNLFKIIKPIEGWALDGITQSYISIPFASANNVNVSVVVVADNITIRSEGDWSSYTESYITLYYTKLS